MEARPLGVGGIMLHFSERRHRLQGDELPPVKEAVYHDLVRRIESRDDLLITACLFRVWFRMETHCKNKPSYPGHSTWEEREASLDFGTVSLPPETYDYGTISPPTDLSDNATVSPSAESALDLAVKMSLWMSKEGT